MTEEEILPVRWNNLLSLGLGLPAPIYVAVALSASVWSGRSGMIRLGVIGVLC